MSKIALRDRCVFFSAGGNTPCIDDHKMFLEDYETTGELSAVCAQIVGNACTWHELDDQKNDGQLTFWHDQ